MKIPIFIFISTLCAITSAVFVPPRLGHKPILGQKECTRGPTYWCQNLTAASGCRAVKHCIQTVWVHKQLPPDNSSVCQICLDMVKQARDQLESNETQELIKEVFEGSCALLHLKPVVEECDKIADQYIPDLIDTLASEMNPQVVCSVAGLCNNAKVHQLLEEAGENVNKGVIKRNTCNDCHTVVDIVESKFNKMSRDEVLQGFLEFCGRLGSFSDGCSNIIITYFEQIYSHLQNHLNSNEVCLMSGECSSLFHKHTTNVEITPLSHVGYIPVKKINSSEEDDLPCDLCEQLVTHLREVLVANTTETEFKEILEGLCKETGKFTQECLGLVDQYYSEIYNYLVQELQPKGLCILIGICHPVNGTKIRPIAPLLPPESAKLASKLTQVEKAPLVHVPLHKDKATVRVTPSTVSQNQEDLQQLPIDLLMGPHTQIGYNKELCEFCQYFLHFVQEAITEPKTEEKIKEAIDKACSLLPNTVNSTCITFVDTYEPALVALLAQEIDPSQICPLIRVCPAANNKDVEVFMESKGDSKCPLCLFAVSKLESMIKDKKSKENIKNALDKVCLYLPNEMVEECKDFIQTYTDELVEMLIADLKPEEICVYLKLCSDSRPASTLPPYVDKRVGGNIETNVIPDNTVNGKLVGQSEVKDGVQCVLCEFVMKEIDDALKDKTTDDEIEQAVRSVCNIMPKSVKTQCNDFINQYGDSIIQLLISALEPSDICSYLKLCNSKIQQMKAEILECPVCQLAVETMEKILSNPKVDHKIEHVLEKTCRGLPTQYKNKCDQIIEDYGEQIIQYLVTGDKTTYICRKLQLCKNSQIWLGTNCCLFGPSYWCESEDNADECGAREHSEKKVWRDATPTRTQNIVGSNLCTRGPSHWCASEENADSCPGTRAYCESKVWGGPKPRSNRSERPGSNPCTRGPSHWCQSEENADKCQARDYCVSKIWGGPKPKSKRQVGGDPCTWGPSYWCDNEENADKCQARDHCESKVWGGPKPRNKRSERPGGEKLGSNKCTWGPSHWCKSEENADSCPGARAFCESKVWGGPKPNN